MLVLDKLVPITGGVGLLASNLEATTCAAVTLGETETSGVMLEPVLLTTPVKLLVPSRVMLPPAVRLVGPVETVSVLLVPWVMLPVVAVRSKVLALTTPFTARLVAALALRLPAVVTVPSVKLFTSLSVMVLPVALTEPLKSLAPPAVTVPPAVRLVGPVVTVSVLLVPWVMLPVVAVSWFPISTAIVLV